MTAIDFIGDIHGYSDKLEELLLKLGYSNFRKGFRHPSRKAFFVGDYIDRGPNNTRVVEIVRAMVDAGDATALCGNHEHNAICYNTKVDDGYLRKHTAKNRKQHAATLDQFKGNQRQYDEAIAWFKTLPLYFETDQFRAVHATWNYEAIAYLKRETENGILSDHHFQEFQDENSTLFKSVEMTCKGEEAELPNNESFLDKDGNERHHIRIKWWLDPTKFNLKELSILEDIKISKNKKLEKVNPFYGENEVPVFFGHYWLKGEPNLYRNNICCLDYSVAKKGFLCAYRFNGESRLENSNLVYV